MVVVDRVRNRLGFRLWMRMRVRSHNSVSTVGPDVSVLEVFHTFADATARISALLAVAVVGGAVRGGGGGGWRGRE